MYLCGSAHSKQVRVRLTSENKLRRDSKKEMSGNQARPEKEANPLELAIDEKRSSSIAPGSHLCLRHVRPLKEAALSRQFKSKYVCHRALFSRRRPLIQESELDICNSASAYLAIL
jgi:hypothetical protein